MNIQSLPINHYLFADWRSFVSSPSSATPNKPASQFTKPLFLLPIRLHFFLPRAYILPLWPFATFVWHFSKQPISIELAFLGSANLWRKDANFCRRSNGLEWYNARGRSRPFSLFFGSALALIWMIQWRCAFCVPSPFKIPFFTAPPHPRRPRDLPFWKDNGDQAAIVSPRRENHSLVNRLDKENPSLIDPKLGELIHTEWVFYQYECHLPVKVKNWIL